MPLSVLITRKNGTIRNTRMIEEHVPKVGEIINCLIDEETVEAKVNSIQETTVGQSIDQPVSIIEATEV